MSKINIIFLWNEERKRGRALKIWFHGAVVNGFTLKSFMKEFNTVEALLYFWRSRVTSTLLLCKLNIVNIKATQRASKSLKQV